MEISALSPDQRTCLDALLLCGEYENARSVADLLSDASIRRADGRGFTQAAVRNLLNEVRPDTLSSIGYVRFPMEERVPLLAARGTRDNVTLQRLAATALRTGLSAYRYGAYAESANRTALALLAGDADAFRQHYAKHRTHTRYAASGLTLLDVVQGIHLVSFWDWRDAPFQLMILGYWGEAPERLTVDATQTALAILRQRDLLDQVHYRRYERAGVARLDAVIPDGALRAKHFDLDQLSRLAAGQPVDADLLYERVVTHEGKLDFIDYPLLAAAYRDGTLTAGQLQRHLTDQRLAETDLAFAAFHHWAVSLTAAGADFDLAVQRVRYVDGYGALVLLWVSAWLGVRPPEGFLPAIQEVLPAYARLPWLYGELQHGLATVFPLHPEQPAWRRAAEELAGRYGFHYLLGLQTPRPRWEGALQAIERLVGPAERQQKAPGEEDPAYRTVWIVDLEEEKIYPKEQKRGKRGYSKGRKLGWEELFKPSRRAFRTPHDLNAVHALSFFDGRPVRLEGYITDNYVRVDFARLLYELAGHPHLLLGETHRTPLTVARAEPGVTVEDRGATLQLRFHPPAERPGHYQLRRTTPTAYTAYYLSERQLALATSIGYGLDLPREARDRLDRLLDGLRRDVQVQSDTELLDTDLDVVAGTDRISVHLLPLGDGYEVQLLARPLPEVPRYFPPGEGTRRELIADDDGRRVLERDLAAESAAAAAVAAACPALGGVPSTGYLWYLDDETEALTFLLELRRLVEADRVEVAYPQGQPLRLDGQADFDSLKLRVGKRRDWFEIGGELTADEGHVVNLQLVLEQLRKSKSPFVRLDKGRFITLTEELRDRLERMDGMLYPRGQDGHLELPPLAAGAFDELLEGFDDASYDAEWRESLERMRAARAFSPRAPEPFAADLRPYQREGYDWLARLAAWGVGACLADDMGLGKTVQALALLTDRAARGPALVLAPASVVRNWRDECLRFAPALRPVLLARRDDVPLLEQLGPGDLLLVSYGLLPFVDAELAALSYATVVLDEAQAIKNPTTKRARAVRELRADFRIATTGTPIENHLGELWSLFRFLNPGLLGSRKAFNEQYGQPIAAGDELRRDQLRRLVQPFILRRRKDEVLRELPAKTEVILTVTPSPAEAALYEALRRDALAEIEEAPPEKKKFIILRQLTRLRQAACHPRLVRPQSKLPAAKLELVAETILELLDNGHQALIFSQFVKHLKLVEDWVREAGIPYQYLDGSTPGGERARRVAAFQAGAGKLFLISLKAGGTGLNLTAADYVLHLDPWWNPAAEDQASDRAHRIGQQRPVTVYRFVTEGTIEEKVIALHADKRDLADQVLAGTAGSAALPVDEILQLLGA